MLSRRGTLFLASFLTLYFELVLIRWVPGHVRILGYFTNFVLIGCFFGIGLGMVLSGSARDLGRWAPLGIVTLVLLSIACKGLWVMPSFEDRLFLEYGGIKGVTIALFPVLVVFYLVIAGVFVPFGQMTGRCFAAGSTLADYSVNLLGAMSGIAVFFLYSWLALPAWAWFGLGMPLLGLLAAPTVTGRAQALGCAVLVVALVWQTDRGTIWSPYQKIDVMPLAIDRATGALVLAPRDGDIETLPAEVGFNVRVNDDFYQLPVDLSDAALAKYPQYPTLRQLRNGYALAFRIKPNARRVLIVGGGTGNDAAAALRHGAQQVDVVDIDPVIVELGRKGHPEKPYDDPRVRVWVDDARHFFHHAQPGYDVIVFAFLDSHRLLSTLSSLRLDSYVFTIESFTEARGLLAVDGVQVTSFAVDEPWLETRFYEMLRSAYEAEPVEVNVQLKELGNNGLTYLSGPGTEAAAKALGVTIQPRPVDAAAVPATDDWPFIYARGRLIAAEYLLALSLVVLLSVVSLRAAAGQKHWPDAHFFWLGAGFLLIETKNVTTLALVFGSTWYVNSVVFFSVLVMALLSALLLAWTDRVRIGWAYGGLFAAIALNLLVPLRDLAGAGLGTRLLLVGGITALPVFFSGIIFAHSFKKTPDPARALGANVLGGVLGGVLEYLSLLFGLRSLFLLIALFYGFSLAALLRQGRRLSVDASAG